MDDDSSKDNRGPRRRRKSGEASLSSGIAFTIIFGAIYLANGSWIWLFPLCFIGIIPVVEGIRRIVVNRRQPKIESAHTESSNEKEVLRIAKNEKGKVTPAVVALNTDLSLEDSQKILEKMVQKGYASMQVTSEGRIEYEFPEFFPRIEKP